MEREPGPYEIRLAISSILGPLKEGSFKPRTWISILDNPREHPKILGYLREEFDCHAPPQLKADVEELRLLLARIAEIEQRYV